MGAAGESGRGALAERGLGYAVQSMNASMLERIPETTLVQALAAQTAGVQVVSSSGRPGAGARITIRGESSFQGTGQPLFVIDGNNLRHTRWISVRSPLG